jgi:hypothetical protein
MPSLPSSSYWARVATGAKLPIATTWGSDGLPIDCQNPTIAIPSAEGWNLGPSNEGRLVALRTRRGSRRLKLREGVLSSNLRVAESVRNALASRSRFKMGCFENEKPTAGNSSKRTTNRNGNRTLSAARVRTRQGGTPAAGPWA